MTNPVEKVVLKSNDGKEIEVEKVAIERSIPLPNVESDILKVIIEFCNIHKEDPPYEEESSSDDEDSKRTAIPDYIETEDEKLLTDLHDIDIKKVYALMTAANYMDIKELVDVCAKYIANLIRGRTADELRDILKIECDLTEEEIKEIEEENKWAEDF